MNILRNKVSILSNRIDLISSQQVLVLSTGYEPLFKTGWKRAISAVVSGRAEVIEAHETLWIGTPSGKIKFPTVVRFLTGVIAAKLQSINRKQRPSKKMLWLRDDKKCQYCNINISLASATIEHVLPKSRGGDSSWTNLVIACAHCNCKKGNALPRECSMHPTKRPAAPGRFMPIII